MKNNPLTDILSDPTRGENRASGVLSAIFRQALSWGRRSSPIGFDGWGHRQRLFFQKPHNTYLKNDHGNLNKDLTRPEFTWPTFKKAVDFLNPIEATFTVVLIWPNDEGEVKERRSTYTLPLTFGQADTMMAPFPFFYVPEGETPPDVTETEVNDLAYLWRQIVMGEQITEAKWSDLLDRYVTSPISGLDLSVRKGDDWETNLKAAKSSTQRNLFENTFSWKRFRTGLNVLDAKEIHFQLTCIWSKKAGDQSTYQRGTLNPKYHLPRHTNALRKAL